MHPQRIYGTPKMTKLTLINFSPVSVVETIKSNLLCLAGIYSVAPPILVFFLPPFSFFFLCFLSSVVIIILRVVV